MEYPLYLPGQPPGVLTVTEKRRVALPFSPEQPFPLPTLFCFARVECRDGKWWAVFAFDERGWPVFPEK